MVRQLEQWAWSSYLPTCGQAAKPDWLQTDFLLAQFSAQRARAMKRYVECVHEGARLPCVWSKLQGQIYLGSEDFVTNMQRLIETKPTLTEVSLAQRRAMARELSAFSKSYEKTEAAARAYLSGQHTMAAIAKHFNVHYATVSRWVKAYEAVL